MRNRTPTDRAPRAPRPLLAAGIAAVALLTAALAPAEGARRPGSYPVLQRRADEPAPTREDTARAVHLLSRATFGVRPEDVDEVLRIGRQAWLDRQLHPDRIDDAALEARLAAFPAAAMSASQLVAAYPPPQANPALRARRDSLRREREMQGDSGMAMRPNADASMDPQSPTAVRPRRRRAAPGDTAMAARADGAGFAAGQRPRRARLQGPAAIEFDLAGARLQRDAYSERQLQEVMTDFWFNHFNVFFGKNLDRYLVGSYEREAIRPNVFGKFRDLLGATATHPAMLVYLDNAQSVVPDSMRRYTPMSALPGGGLRARGGGLGGLGGFARVGAARRRPGFAAVATGGDTAAARRRRERGLNENYARELMELHTLGVNGGYTQHDVIEVARALTGWSVERNAAAGEPRFVFRPALHDYGPKTILGRRFPAGRGQEEGEEVLDMLAKSPATARHVSYELAQRFVADDPPQALVDRLVQVWTRTDGDLRAVTRALFTSPEFDDARYRDAKVKTPLEFVAGALRVTGADAGASRGVIQTLRQMGELPYFSTPPTGYPNTSTEWTNSGAMLNRMNFALALAAGRVDAVRVDASRFAPAQRASTDEARVAALARTVLPGVTDPALLRTIADDVAQQTQLGDEQKSARALGLLLGSPDFQRR